MALLVYMHMLQNTNILSLQSSRSKLTGSLKFSNNDTKKYSTKSQIPKIKSTKWKSFHKLLCLFSPKQPLSSPLSNSYNLDIDIKTI